MAPSAPPEVKLFRGFPVSNSYVWSPFVCKLETRFRLGGLKYNLDVGSPIKAPKGKIPYVEVTESGSTKPTILSDSTVIARDLVAEGALLDLNSALSPSEKAQDLAIRALLEDKLYFYQTYERWHDNYDIMRPGVLGAVPWPAQVAVGLLAYRSQMAAMQGQGSACFTSEEQNSFKAEIWQGIDALLVESAKKGSKSKDKAKKSAPYWVLGGSEPTEADSTLYGFIVAGLVCNAGPFTQKLIRGFPTILDYARRIHDTYFSDYELWED